MKETGFEKRLRILNEVVNALSLEKSVKDLCCRAVMLGRSRLGFDRLSTWFVDTDSNFITGSFGVDEDGKIREETAERVRIDDDPAMRQIHANKARSVLRKNVVLRDGRGNIVGRGSHIIAAIWNGKEVVGYVSTDNLLRRRALTEHDRKFLEMFASTFGHLYSLKRTEETLHAAYNKLKEIQTQLVQAAKMEVVGSLATGVAHEVKNPLAVILQGIDYISKKQVAEDDNTRRTLRCMRDAVQKANDIVKGLLDFSSLSKWEFIPQNLNSIIEKALRVVSYEIEKSKIKVIREFQKDLPDVRIDSGRIEQVLVNLFLNAIEQMPRGGELKIRTYYFIGRRKGDNRVLVEIEDTGPGIPPDVLDRIFDPFFTTRRGSGGTGLGLSIVRSIMEMHNGKVEMDNKKSGHGAKAVLIF